MRQTQFRQAVRSDDSRAGDFDGRDGEPAALKEEYPSITTMGNLSTYILEFGDPEKVSRRTEALIGDKIDIIAPACGLSTSSAIENIRALTETVKESG